MYTATMALSTAAQMNNCGMDRCSSLNHVIASAAAITMKPAFRMLLQAIMRARWLSALRDRISAYSGTMNRPPDTPTSVQSSAMRQPPEARNAVQLRPVTAELAPGCAWSRCSSAAVMPMEPSGTSPISTLCPDNRSQAREPSAVPIENDASSSVYTVLSPPRTSLAYAGNCASSSAPTSQNQEMPSSELRMARLCAAKRSVCQVAVKGLKFTFNPGSVASARGMNRAQA